MSEKLRTFKGPLFVVGMARSGTSLMRAVLNRNPVVGISPVETLFIPYIISRFRHKALTLEQKDRHELHSLIKMSHFLGTIKKGGFRSRIQNWTLLLNWILWKK